MNNEWLYNEEMVEDGIYKDLGMDFKKRLYDPMLRFFTLSVRRSNTNHEQYCLPTFNIDNGIVQLTRVEKKQLKQKASFGRDVVVQLYIKTCMYIRHRIMVVYNKEYNDPCKILCKMVPYSPTLQKLFGVIFKPLTEKYIKECIESWEEKHNMSMIEHIQNLFPYMEIEMENSVNSYSASIYIETTNPELKSFDDLRSRFDAWYSYLYHHSEISIQKFSNNANKIVKELLKTQCVFDTILYRLKVYGEYFNEKYNNQTFDTIVFYNGVTDSDFFNHNSVVIEIDDCDSDNIAYIAIIPNHDNIKLRFNLKRLNSSSDNDTIAYNEKIFIISLNSLNQNVDKVANLIDEEIIYPISNYIENTYPDDEN